jgi:hypothetical protein
MAPGVTDAQRLSTEIDVFAQIIDDLAAIAKRTDPERRSELIRVRRNLSDHIGRMRDVGSRAFADPLLADEFRSRLSSVLTVVSMHQARWPAVAIDEDEATYRTSASAAAVSNRAFIDWTRSALAQTP